MLAHLQQFSTHDLITVIIVADNTQRYPDISCLDLSLYQAKNVPPSICPKCFNFQIVSVTNSNSPVINLFSFLYDLIMDSYSIRESKCLSGPDRPSWGIVHV